MQSSIISLCDAVARNPQVRLQKPASFTVNPGNHTAIVGPNGAGKSILVDMIMGKIPLLSGSLTYNFPSQQPAYEAIKYIAFRDTYGSADANYYYQQRWNSTEQDDVPTVREKLGDISQKDLAEPLLRFFGLEPLLDKKIILLSSGELRKFQLVQALLSAPYVLIMDNPFIGLDVETRAMLTELLQQISELENLQIILVLSAINDIPDFITDVVSVNNQIVYPAVPHQKYIPSDYFDTNIQPKEFDEIARKIQALSIHKENNQSPEIVRLNQVSITYGDRTILKELSWTVLQGQKWALSGSNGSGKSTLLSLICADNPQSYARDIRLFGRQRGTGESIWDIKKRIGYVSPEMHRAYRKNIPAVEIVASGLHDSIGLYKRPQPEQMDICEYWMDIFGIAHLRDKPFLQLSSGEQRLTLLARAFVKDPELIILDEPLHGLDTFNRARVKNIIDIFSRRKGKTLIMVTHYQEELPPVITHKLELKKTN